MNEQEIRAKALEVAVLIKGPPVVGGLSKDTDMILSHYLFLADAIERHIRGSSPKNPVKSAET
jgi:hypothetical protein